MEQRNNDLIFLTETKKTDQEAIDDKMKALSPKLFGLFNPMPYELINTRKVFIPCEFLIFSYRISRGKSKNHQPNKLDQTGEIGIVFDVNEVHAFFFDLIEELKLIKKPVTSLDGVILPDQCSSQAVLEKSAETVRNKYLNRGLKQISELNLKSRRKFYRQAWELTVTAHGKEMQRYAYMDVYGSMNEHVSGLKVRLDV